MIYSYVSMGAQAEVSPITRTRVAIEHAMQAVRAVYLNGYDSNSLQKSPEVSPLDQWLQERSDKHCENASAFVINRLLTNNPGLFPICAMIRGRHDERSPFHFQVGEAVSWHSYFLTKDIEGMWYAGSPANHNQNALDGGMLTRILVSRDLEDVIRRIQVLDGGRWSHPLRIEDGIHRGYIAPERLEYMRRVKLMTFDPYLQETYVSNRRESSAYQVEEFSTDFHGEFGQIQEAE